MILDLTKKGKLDRLSIWVVEIMMSKKLIVDIYSGYNEMLDLQTESETENAPSRPQLAEAGIEAGVGAGAEAPADAGAV